MVVLSGVDEAEAIRVGERVREQVARTEIPFDQQAFRSPAASASHWQSVRATPMR